MRQSCVWDSSCEHTWHSELLRNFTGGMLEVLVASGLSRSERASFSQKDPDMKVSVSLLVLSELQLAHDSSATNTYGKHTRCLLQSSGHSGNVVRQNSGNLHVLRSQGNRPQNYLYHYTFPVISAARSGITTSQGTESN